MKDKKDIEEMSCHELYAMMSERMLVALMFHNDMSDYFNFLGLHGFECIHEYQYHEESISRRHLKREYLDIHNKIIKEHFEPEYFEDVIPTDWSKYTRMDIDKSVIPKFVKSSIEKYKDWEEETKEMYETAYCVAISKGYVVDADIIKDYISCVQSELKKIYRLYEELNCVGFDPVYIVEMQKEIHDCYKEKMKKIKIT